MIYPTPSEDFDGVVVGLRLLEEVVELIDRASASPIRRAHYLQEAASRLKEAWMAVQTAAGRALKESWQSDPADSYTEDELDLFEGNDGS